MTTIETKAISEISFPTVTVCPPKGTFTNLNYDLVNINNSMFGIDQRQSLKSFIHKAIIDQEFEAVLEEDKSYKIRGKYESWFKGTTQFTLPETKSKTTFFLWTTANEGEAESPNFGVDYSRRSFPLRLSYLLLIFPPKKFNDDSFPLGKANVTYDKKFKLEIHVDTKESEGEGSELIEISPSGFPTSEIVRLSGPVDKNKTYPVLIRSRKNTRQILIRFERQLTKKDLQDWNEKRNTGFRAKWYYTDSDGNKLNIESDDIQSVPMNALFVKFVKIYHVLLLKGLTKDRILKILKKEKMTFTEKNGSAVKGKCFEGVLLDYEVDEMIQNIALSNGVSGGQTKVANISNDDINDAGQLFVFLAICPKVYWIAWSEFFDNLLDNFNLKVILLNLFRIRQRAAALEMERESNITSSLLFEITNRSKLQQYNIASMFQGIFDLKIEETVGK